MKGIIAIVSMICGTALLISQFVREGASAGGPAYCEFVGIGMCLAGVVMGFLAVGLPVSNAGREPAAV